MSNKKQPRWELGYFNNTPINSLIDNALGGNIGSVYIAVNVSNLSDVREKLVRSGYTTRLFVANINGENHFLIYGKKRGNKGVFTEHCKNTVHYYSDVNELHQHLLEVSSLEGQMVITDTATFSKNAQNKQRVVIDYGIK